LLLKTIAGLQNNTMAMMTAALLKIILGETKSFG
jgi:hypothetical protein